MSYQDPDAHFDAPRDIVAVSNIYPAEHALDWHAHARDQLLYAATGMVAVTTDFGTWMAPPERAVLIPAGARHAVRMVGRVTTRSVMLRSSASTDTATPTCRVIRVKPLLRALLFAAADMPLEYDENGRDGLAMRLLSAEITAAEAAPLEIPMPADPRFARLCRAFLLAPDVTQTIDLWSGHLAMHRKTFTRHFLREAGMTFAVWKQRACIALALSHLMSGRTITQVAFDLGYENSASFSAMFKRVMGVSPSKYLEHD